VRNRDLPDLQSLDDIHELQFQHDVWFVVDVGGNVCTSHRETLESMFSNTYGDVWYFQANGDSARDPDAHLFESEGVHHTVVSGDRFSAIPTEESAQVLETFFHHLQNGYEIRGMFGVQACISGGPRAGRRFAGRRINGGDGLFPVYRQQSSHGRKYPEIQFKMYRRSAR
ncbi:MAG: hypothetical protein ABEJ65_00485, partial [bacterium]